MKNSLRQLKLSDVGISSGLWKSKMDVNREETLPIEFEQCRKTGRIDALKLEWKEGKPNRPHIFWDSDIAKWIEAAAYSLSQFPDPGLERKVDAVVKMIEKAQMPDGYFNSHFQSCGIEGRWKNLRDNHELYCAGHLIEAAVAYHQATGKRTLLDIMCRFADHIDRTFGNEKSQIPGYCGHEEIELALVKLYRETGDKKYLNLAKYFVDERGKEPLFYDDEALKRGEDPKKFWAKTYEYCQSHIPVRKQKHAVGHAVRGMYLYCSMADLASETNDKALLQACKNIWNDLVTKKMHVTGGLGPTHANEGFTCAYDLPNETAYLETCAAIGLFLWAYRLFNADPDSRYTDVMELALYNGIASGVSLDGTKFLYGNPLATYPGFDGNGRYQGDGYKYQRSEWFDCACCPPNIARLYASLPAFIYSVSDDSILTHLYTSSDATIKLKNSKLRISQKTNYPWNGKIQIQVEPDKETAFSLLLRIPEWCAGKFKLSVNGKKTYCEIRKGYAKIARKWRSGDKVELDLQMPSRLLSSHPSARQNCGRVAIQRGPLVYCIEEADNGKDLNDIAILRNSQFREIREKSLGGYISLSTRAIRSDKSVWKNKLYSTQNPKNISFSLKAIPYFLWGNRKPGEMLTWIRTQ